MIQEAYYTGSTRDTWSTYNTAQGTENSNVKKHMDNSEVNIYTYY